MRAPFINDALMDLGLSSSKLALLYLISQHQKTFWTLYSIVRNSTCILLF